MKDNIIVTSAYLGYNQSMVGGYSFYHADDLKTHGIADFVPYDDVIKVCENQGIKRIHLAGDWSRMNRKGYGEFVTIQTAKKIIKQMRSD